MLLNTENSKFYWEETSVQDSLSYPTLTWPPANHQQRSQWPGLGGTPNNTDILGMLMPTTKNLRTVPHSRISSPGQSHLHNGVYFNISLAYWQREHRALGMHFIQTGCSLHKATWTLWKKEQPEQPGGHKKSSRPNWMMFCCFSGLSSLSVFPAWRRRWRHSNAPLTPSG